MALSAALKFGAALALAAALAAVYQRRYVEDVIRARVDQIHAGLLSIERNVTVDSYAKVAVGFGACKDLVVNALDLFRPLAAAGANGSDAVALPRKPLHHDTISTMEEFIDTFVYFFQHAAAAERFVTNKTFFSELVEAASRLPEARWSLGGNAPLMSSRISKEGFKVLLGAQMSQHLMGYLPNSVSVVGEVLTDDEVHLILEYPAGASWGPYKAPKANRFIIHSDHNNPTLSSLEAFQKELSLFQPDLLVISGLHAMDNFPFASGQREARLSKVQHLMSSQPLETKIHYEMASFTDENLLKLMVKLIIPHVDSLGMNEQELPNLVSVLETGNPQHASDPYPRVASILDQMRDLLRLCTTLDSRNGYRQLTRIHVHTLAYQAIMVKKGANWRNSISAAAKAALTANRYVCGTSNVDTSKAKVIMDESFSVSLEVGSRRITLDERNPVSCWEEDDVEICVAPVLVCTDVYQTAGGGDNISSVGLVIQV